MTSYQGWRDFVPLINFIRVSDDYRLYIELYNGHAIILNMESKLNTFRFSPLANKDVFAKAYTDGFSVIWRSNSSLRKVDIRMSVVEIMNILQEISYISLVG